MKLPFSDLRAFQRDPLAFLVAQNVQSDEDLLPIALNHKPMYLVNNPELVKPILKIPESQVTKGALIQKLRSVIGDSVVILTGEEHLRRRAALNPFFVRSNVEKLSAQFSAEIRRSAAELTQVAEFDAHDFGSAIALRLVSVAAFGHRVLTPGDEQLLVQAVRLIEDDVADEIFRILPPTPWKLAAQKRRRAFSRKTMETIVGRVRQAAAGTSALEALDSLQLDEADLVNEVLTLLLAGHHTTGAAVTWVLHALAEVEGLADTIAAEAALVVDDSGEINPSLLPKAKTTMTMVLEIMRLFPSSWWFSREVLEPIELAGHRLKRGTSLLICPWLFHRSPRYWDAPDEFRLDRRFSQNPAYLPFGDGPRVCIGRSLATLELQLIALELASSFSISFETPWPAPKPMVMLMPPDMKARLELRLENTDSRSEWAA